MMENLWLFNPENDLALASGKRHFTPPKGALAVSRGGELLPLWWAEHGDAVLAGDGAVRHAERLREQFALPAEVVELRSEGVLKGMPWGWSHDAVRRLTDGGADRRLMPSDEMIDAHRMLSHRRTARRLLAALGEPEELLPVEAFSSAEAREAIACFGGDAYIKQPWSGSGRGVFRTQRLPQALIDRYLEGFIRSQGSVIVEKTRNRTGDFAMLFQASESGCVNFAGLSSFIAGPSGAYGGNLVAPQSVIADRIGLPVMHLVADLERELAAIIAGRYVGWIGVDMMTVEDGEGQQTVMPCVEINFRMTMGVAAMLINRRLPSGGGCGLLTATDREEPGDIVVSSSERSAVKFVVRKI